MPKIAIITLDAEKDEYLVAWVRDDMTIKSFCEDNVLVLQDAKKCAGSHLTNGSTYAGETTFLNFHVTMDRDVLYWSPEAAIKCPAGTKVRPIEIAPEPAQPELTYSESPPNREGWYWMRDKKGFESVKKVFIHSMDDLSIWAGVWATDIYGNAKVYLVGQLKDMQWAGPIPKPGEVKHA